ncbi:MAG: menaquinone biosynthesis decarboxylase [Deltaproteobacteria bacterium]|nr:menaquinone biosynthesis decarboxylase [Deltaproteobacteria bacterium]MBW2071990.1 menaquinone biosynthesis decarboxylase [Deltaproteobacteria bacterium]
MKQSYRNLTEFIRVLERAGELEMVERTVSPYLEISKLTDEQSKSPGGGKALYFKKVKGSPFPAATNLFGSWRRICLALGVNDLEQLGDRIRALLELTPPATFKEALGLLPTALSVSRYFPRRTRTKTPPCQEVVYRGDQVDLSLLPVLHCWPRDAGPFITLPLVFTRSLTTGKRNVGMYRMQVFDRKTTGMHWHIHKDGSHYYNEYLRARERMPVAVAIGADPATIYAATAPMPRHMDELILAGFLRNRPVRLTSCLTVDLQVPAEAEFVLEGYVDPGELRREGPFGDHTGYYSLADDYPVFHVTALSHRKKPLYCATLVGRPPMEDCYLGKVTERLFLPILQAAFPEIRDYWFPWEGVFHNIVVVSIDKEFAGHAHKVMHGLWGQGQMSFCKTIVVVDRQVDPSKAEQVMAAIVEKLDPGTDLTLTMGVLDVLDHSSPTPNFGSKIGIDLTSRFPGEPPRQPPPALPDSMLPPASLLEQVQRRVPGVARLQRIDWPAAAAGKSAVRNRILLFAVEKNEQRPGKYFADGLLQLDELQPFSIMLLYDADIDLQDGSLVLWKLFNNVDPARDIFLAGPRLVVDACRKIAADGHTREWPEELSFD